MRTPIWAAVIAAVLMIGTAVSANARSNEGGMRGDMINEDRIRALYGEFAAAWNRHEPATLAEFWAIDGDTIEPDGRQAKGRDEVLVLLQKQHDSVFSDTTLSLGIDDVYFLTANVALVDGSYAISGIRSPSGEPIAPRKGLLTAILIEERGEWQIAASRLMIPTVLPYRPEVKSE